MSNIVVTGIGAVTARGVGYAAQLAAAREGGKAERSLDAFQPAPHLTDKRMLKAVSKVDALGLVAIESLMKDAGLAPGQVSPDRVGLYVGAPSASAFDNEPYVDAVILARASAREFGKTSMASRPTTLLVGLPNNVLCYGAMLLEARGPNSNYTASKLSGVAATLNAAKRVARGQLDLAVAGAFAMHNEAVNSRIYEVLGLTPGIAIADGSAFVSLESRENAAKRGRSPIAAFLGGAMTSDGLGPMRSDRAGRALESAIRRALDEADAGAEEVGLVLLGGTGVEAVDQCQLSVLQRVFAPHGAMPAVATAEPGLGCLMEASGVLELGFAVALLADGQVPEGMALPEFGTRIDPKRPLAMSVVASPWGEYGVTVVSREI